MSCTQGPEDYQQTMDGASACRREGGTIGVYGIFVPGTAVVFLLSSSPTKLFKLMLEVLLLVLCRCCAYLVRHCVCSMVRGVGGNLCSCRCLHNCLHREAAIEALLNSAILPNFDWCTNLNNEPTYLC